MMIKIKIVLEIYGNTIIIMCVEKSSAFNHTPGDMKPVCILSCELKIA